MRPELLSRARHDTPVLITRDPDLVRPYLSDAAHVPDGAADGVAFPRDADQAACVVAGARAVLAIGAQSSLTGGATPRGETLLSTRALTEIERLDANRVRAGAGVPIAVLQRALSAEGLYYPPAPTFDGAYVGGTVATNAAGAATFRYGSTRAWVEALTLVLADGSILDIERGTAVPADAPLRIVTPHRSIDVPLPRYRMPDVPKLSAGYFSADRLDPVDLFVGSEGTLGIVTSATLRVVPKPVVTGALVRCASDLHALETTAALRDASSAGELQVAAVEYVDHRSIARLDDDVLRRAGIARGRQNECWLIVQVEGEAGVDALAAVLEGVGADDVDVALPGDTRHLIRLFELREAVPAAINRAVAEAKARAGPQVQKTAGDMVVPFARLADSLQLYARAFEDRGLEFAVWGHFSDGNLHPNVIPRSMEDVLKGREALLEIAGAVIEMGGAPLAEHGVGRSALKQEMLGMLYGDAGVDQMRAVKSALDPDWKLAPGVLFSRSRT